MLGSQSWSSPGRQLGASVAFQPLGLGARQRSRRRDTWEERADTWVLPLKPEFGVQAWWQSPRRQCGGPAGPGEPWARQWHPRESWCGGTVPVPSAQPELPKELLLRWLNLLEGKPLTGVLKGWSWQPQDQSAPKNHVSLDGRRHPQVSRSPFPS